ncbi:tetratricopeptide repeat protein [Vibrio sp. MEBiC08052]|uniref:tetratricopeptide repeat protein n=1 Tax=Vibrio sp. MEBiC08052 TaxID=1761910 RepID=UPI000740799C|nr:tetratricopeptide repeat protein [Vibrio sp. MEBiC08052]KUI97003.1 hypothetical protein VRK_38580 [Vibrio sp. MEBiC08052]
MLSNITNKELFHVAVDAARQKNTDVTLRYLKELIHRDPQHQHGLFLLGSTYTTLGMFEEAVECLKKSVSQDPQFYMARFQLGLSQLALYLSTEGCSQFEYIMNSDAPAFIKQYSQGFILVQNNQKEQAITSFKQGIELDENSPIRHDIEDIIEAIEHMPEQTHMLSDSAVTQQNIAAEPPQSMVNNDFFLNAYRR